MEVRQIIPAFFAFVFALIVLWALIVYGTAVQRDLAVLAALLGCVSQFAAQDSRPVARGVNLACAYAGFLIIGVAVMIGPA
jgi:hypothetical protein